MNNVMDPSGILGSSTIFINTSMHKLFLVILTIFTITSCKNATYVLLPDTIFTGNVVRPDTSSLDLSGVMQSRYSKGWLVNTPSRRVAVTCTHSNPSVGTDVWFVDSLGNKEHRTIVNVNTIRLSVHDGKPVPLDFSKGTIFDHFYASDITVVLLDQSAPSFVHAYDYATSVGSGSWVEVVNQKAVVINGLLYFTSDCSTAVVKYGTQKLIPGDSGLPWFNTKNQVISHSTGGDMGYGTIYSHPLILDTFKNTINITETITLQ